jgi:hypothetical protein
VTIGEKWPEAMRGITFAKMGQRDKAYAIMINLKASPEQFEMSSMIALLHFALDEVDEGFEWLNRAYEVHDMWLITIQTEPLLDLIRSDSRYLSLLKKTGLVDSSGQALGNLL